MWSKLIFQCLQILSVLLKKKVGGGEGMPLRIGSMPLRFAVLIANCRASLVQYNCCFL